VAAITLLACAAFIVFAYMFAKEVFHLIVHMIGDEADFDDAVIGFFLVIDGLMVGHVGYLIVAGSWRIYVRGPHADKQSGVPVVVQHMNSGLLKEKLASSLMGVSSVFVTRQLIEIGQTAKVDLTVICVVAGLHVLLVGGYFVMNHTNIKSARFGGGISEEHHDASSNESPKEGTHA
jgi:uncharacterized protein (TIGR00645 family)